MRVNEWPPLAHKFRFAMYLDLGIAKVPAGYISEPLSFFLWDPTARTLPGQPLQLGTHSDAQRLLPFRRSGTSVEVFRAPSAKHPFSQPLDSPLIEVRGLPLRRIWSLGTMGMGTWPGSRVVRTSASDFPQKSYICIP